MPLCTQLGVRVPTLATVSALTLHRSGSGASHKGQSDDAWWGIMRWVLLAVILLFVFSHFTFAAVLRDTRFKYPDQDYEV